MKMEGTRTFPVGWKARELWAQLTQMAVSAILLLLLFVPLGSWAREHLQFAPGKTLPGNLVDYWVTDASSQCVCRIMCIRNISCSGVTVQYNGAQLTCEFSHDEVLVENLVERSDANTWIFNATTTTTTPAATTTTTSATITTTPSTSSTTTVTTTTTTTPTTTDTTTTPTTTNSTTTTPTSTDTTTTTTTSTTTTTTTTTPTTTKAKTCPSGYDMFNSSCYYVRYSYKDWETARSDCQGSGSELVRITSQWENDFIKGQLIGSGGFWIGLNDRATENSFKWSVDNSAVEDNGNYSSWADGQPNDHNGQDCVAMYSDGKWKDEECSTWYFYYICEKPAS